MDREFVYLNCDDSIIEVCKIMDQIRRFTCPIVNDNKQYDGWINSLDITKGLRKENQKIKDYIEITTIHEDDPTRLAVVLTANNKFIIFPVINDDNEFIDMKFF